MARTALAKNPQPHTSILLVEDQPGDAFVVSSLLDSSRHVNYTTHHVQSQAEALAALAAPRDYDVCLLDLTLPDAAGFSALIEIQELAPNLPVVVLTGINDTELAKRAVGRGAQDYLLKDELEVGTLIRAIDYGMERKRIAKSLFQRANFDTLTGLANRDLFTSRLRHSLARAQRSRVALAILFIDLDRFKPINDTHGHEAGDEALRTAAQRIKSCLRAYDTAARFGGDEFAVLLEGVSNPRDAATIARKILAALIATMNYSGKKLELGASIGIAFTRDDVEQETLLLQADTAMYHAKKDGGNTCRFYAESMQSEANARLGMEEDLRTAIKHDELRLHYQPLIHPNGATLGVEALLRWKHRERGLLSAHEFLLSAEDARLMPELTQWICAQLINDLGKWKNLAPLTLAVNLSLSQLDAPELIAWLMPVLQEKILGQHRLALEIPEDLLAQLNPKRLALLGKLSEMGVSLHLDHFGRSALALSTLNALPFSLLKLDHSLIQSMSKDVPGDVLIRVAITLAHQLGMKAGAVGVETQWQAEALKGHSCDLIQGFITCEPMSGDELVQWMRRQESTRI